MGFLAHVRATLSYPCRKSHNTQASLLPIIIVFCSIPPYRDHSDTKGKGVETCIQTLFLFIYMYITSKVAETIENFLIRELLACGSKIEKQGKDVKGDTGEARKNVTSTNLA